MKNLYYLCSVSKFITMHTINNNLTTFLKNLPLEVYSFHVNLLDDTPIENAPQPDSAKERKINLLYRFRRRS